MAKQKIPDTARAAQHFMNRLKKNQLDFESLNRVIDEALSGNSAKMQLGTHILFKYIIETLSDTFLYKDRKSLEKIMAHLISRLRTLPQAQEFHTQLKRWEFNSEKDLINRIENYLPQKKFPHGGPMGHIKKIFIPSRVTLGADVLLNTLVIERMKCRFPEAEIIFLGSEKNGSILKGNQGQFRVLPLYYNRRGPLLNRFLNWLEIVRQLEKEITGLKAGEDYLIINTDSRLMQTGILPVIPPPEEHSHYFCWIPAIEPGNWKKTSQAEDLLNWLNSTFGESTQNNCIYPQLHLSENQRNYADQVFQFLNPALEIKAKPYYIVSMSFGVGGNQEKRIKKSTESVSHFEMNLILKLLANGNRVILDRGFGTEESQQVDGIIKEVRNRGFKTGEITEEHSTPQQIEYEKTEDIHLLAFKGSINKFAALIDRSDCYVGYDSLGQHLAAGLSRDVITIFAGYHSQIFPLRWKPWGKGSIHVIEAKCGPFNVGEQEKLVENVYQVFKTIRTLN